MAAVRRLVDYRYPELWFYEWALAEHLAFKMNTPLHIATMPGGTALVLRELERMFAKAAA